MRAQLRWVVVACAVGAFGIVGCSSEDGDDIVKIRDDVPDPPPGGVQMVSPTFEVPPGEEVFVCMKMPYEIEKDYFVQASYVWQVPGGHHTLLLWGDGDVVAPDEPHPCDAGPEMTNARFVGVGSGDGDGVETPDGLVLKIPTGSAIYTQSHYVNTTDEVLIAQDVLNLELIDAEDVQDILGSYANVDLTFSLPPNQQTTRVIECVPPHEMNVPWMFPHMHDWGLEYKLEVIRDGEVRWMNEGAWDASLRDDFPLQVFEPPLELTPEDLIRTTCTWNNDTNEVIRFPSEMCATFMPYYPSPDDGALWACDEFGNNFIP